MWVGILNSFWWLRIFQQDILREEGTRCAECLREVTFGY